jgi:hypothetical protein
MEEPEAPPVVSDAAPAEGTPPPAVEAEAEAFGSPLPASTSAAAPSEAPAPARPGSAAKPPRGGLHGSSRQPGAHTTPRSGRPQARWRNPGVVVHNTLGLFW